MAQARAGLVGAIQTHDPEQMANANAQLTAGLGRLLAIAEAYPNLKADQSFLRLQDELTGTENRIAVARGDYNQAAQAYNSYIRQFPQTKEFLDKTTDMLKFLLPHYIDEGKSYLTVAFGCTGGQHRSVFIAEEMKKRLEAAGHRVRTTHRDMPR